MKSELIWSEYQTEIRRFVLSKIKDKDDAKDILQEVFVKLHTRSGMIKDEQKIKPWLFQITRNTINDHFRKQKYFVNADKIDLPEEVESKRNESFLNCVQPHMNKLPEKYREALIKVDLESKSQLVLAKELNISYSALKSRVQRGREILKSYFKQCCNISTDKYGNIIAADKKHKCTMC